MPSEPGRHAFEGMFGGGVVNFFKCLFSCLMCAYEHGLVSWSEGLLVGFSFLLPL